MRTRRVTSSKQRSDSAIDWLARRLPERTKLHLQDSQKRRPALARHAASERAGATSALRNGRLSCQFYQRPLAVGLMFTALGAEKAAIETEVGSEPDWQPLPDTNSSRIALYTGAGQPG